MTALAIFDLDNTLIDRGEALTSWSAEFCVSRGLGVEVEESIVKALSDRAYPIDLARLRDGLRLPDTPQSLWREFVEGMAARVRPRPGVLAGLASLRSAGWKLAVVTNGAREIQSEKLRHTGIAGLLDAVVVSANGPRKPDPSLFHTAAKECGTSIDPEHWVIGDNPVTDIGGGRGVGVRTIWITNGHDWPEGLSAPDHAVHDPAGAISFLLDLQKERS
ncbi:HAD family hydrolase [Streptomyces sp. NRRL S-495]|uniref:HAD family hydrolase n=1 Tax=Streptomyces sp. NRRL S-495 TaxID=1609133 RepID=UPI0005F99F5E|nr:HAD family hydrolase [Streptomyces sp. NRRL S-495]KJY32148.1 hypothetical protein VR45_23310 [Streptomyces sp. NRRL S-495]